MEQVEPAPESRMDKELPRKTVSGVLVDGCSFSKHWLSKREPVSVF